MRALPIQECGRGLPPAVDFLFAPAARKTEGVAIALPATVACVRDIPFYPEPFMPSRSVLRRCAGFSLSLLAGLLPAAAQHKLGPSGSFEAPKIAAASDDGEKAIKRFQMPQGWKAELWAAEPDVAHVVAFDVANDGRFFAVESFRAWRGVPDIRGIMDWLDEDLASRSVDDRLAMMQRHLGKSGMDEYRKNTERIRLLRDTRGTGRADSSVVFAENFATPLDGVASGVLARGKDVWFANIPNVWWLRDENLDGVADSRQSISYGHGIRVGFLGHDLHGLTWGPDGRLYFSIGDRASMLHTEGHLVGTPDSGAVFRCNPDGTGMEMIYVGLRNPQELVFDEWGNLFTGDNNSDGGDQARWTYLIEGGDSGWRIGWQFLEKPNPRGPWNSEKMWMPQNDSQPAYITPPIKNITAGPSGNAYYPGTGLGPEWQGTFTLCDFRGSGSGSGIVSFKLKPRGASFEIVDDKKFVWSIEATDGAWGPDGAFWISDWVDGWEPVGKGRIYRFYDTNTIHQPIVKSTRELLASDFGTKTDKALLDLLAHPNFRVRQAAQFTLAERGDAATGKLIKILRTSKDLHARLHSLWALGQIQAYAHKPGREAKTDELDAIVPLLGDKEAHLRANAARVLGDARYAPAYAGLVKLTSDEDAHVRALGTIALGKLGRRDSVPVLFEVLKANADQDPFIRHAAVQALVTLNDFDALEAASGHPDAAVRMGVLLAMRRLGRPEIASFVTDSDPRIVTEAARAINDVPISGALERLAGLSEKPLDPKNAALGRRVLNANYRFGTTNTAAALARVAARDEADAYRVEALEALAEWPANSGRDRITGLWRPTAFARDTQVPADALKPVLIPVLSSAPNGVRAAAARAAGTLRIASAAPTLATLVLQKQGDGAVRSAALIALSQLQSAEYGPALSAAQNDPEELVRKTALKLSVEVPPVASAASGPSGAGAADPTARLAAVLDSGSLSEKQNAFASLGRVPGSAADSLTRSWMQRLLDGTVPAELQLDVLDAAAARPELKGLVDQWKAGHTAKGTNDIAPWKLALTGGNVEAGRKVFVERAEVSCTRCHKISGEGGEVGPELTGLVDKKGREYVLQSIVYPNANIAEGFENLLVTLKNGTAYAGIIKSENATELVLNSPEDGLVTLKKADIATREKGLSGMPDGFGELLSRQDLRNLIEFLASAK